MEVDEGEEGDAVLYVDDEETEFEYAFGFGSVGDVVDRKEVLVINIDLLHAVALPLALRTPLALSMVTLGLVLDALVRTALVLLRQLPLEGLVVHQVHQEAQRHQYEVKREDDQNVDEAVAVYQILNARG